MADGRIRVGIGGWTFEPWRGVFYPAGLAQSKELGYASDRLTAIEINGTYYSTQKPASFAKWAASTPDDFIFSVKASRYCTNRKILGEGGDAVSRFMAQGLSELGSKLGPILWQFMPTKKFDAADFRAFLQLLPPTLGQRALRHAVEVRHESFLTASFIELIREFGVAAVCADSLKYPMISELSSDFVYARLQAAEEALPQGYSDADLDRWASTAKAWSAGEQPSLCDGLTTAGATTAPRDVFVFMINGAKVRAPAAAEALIDRLR